MAWQLDRIKPRWLCSLAFDRIGAGDAVAGDPAARRRLARRGAAAALPCVRRARRDGACACAPACWPKVRFITEPLCAACGMPFEFEVAAGTACAPPARRRERPFGRARAAIAYDDGSRGFILAFKHGDRTDAARVFAPWMAQAGRELLGRRRPAGAGSAALDAPVRAPLQSGGAAGAGGRPAGRRRRWRPICWCAASARRRSPTSGASERAETVRGAFVVPPRRRPAGRGQTHSADRRCLHHRLDHRRLRPGAGAQRRSRGRRADAGARRPAKPSCAPGDADRPPRSHREAEEN